MYWISLVICPIWKVILFEISYWPVNRLISKHIVSLDGIYYYILCLVNGVELQKVWYADSSLAETLIQIYVLYTKVLGGLLTTPKTVELALSHSSRVRDFGGLTTKTKTCKSSIEPFFESVRGIVRTCNYTLYFLWCLIWHQIS